MHIYIMDEYKQQQQRKKEQQQKWYTDNRERLNAKAKAYYADNKQTIYNKSQELTACPMCGTCVKRSGLSHHKHTAKCKELHAMRVIYTAFNK